MLKSDHGDEKMIKAHVNEMGIICFNGQKAGESEELLRSLGYLTLVLPSSSGANRRNQAERLGCWNVIREHHANSESPALGEVSHIGKYGIAGAGQAYLGYAAGKDKSLSKFTHIKMVC